MQRRTCGGSKTYRRGFIHRGEEGDRPSRERSSLIIPPNTEGIVFFSTLFYSINTYTTRFGGKRTPLEPIPFGYSAPFKTKVRLAVASRSII